MWNHKHQGDSFNIRDSFHTIVLLFCSCPPAAALPRHHLHFCIFVSICLKTFFFYICSPICRLISCSTSESVSPVKQAPRKFPSDTEGLVKSLPSGSHQVTLAAPGCAGGRCHHPGAGGSAEPRHRERVTARQMETERERGKGVKESDLSEGSHQSTTNRLCP